MKKIIVLAMLFFFLAPWVRPVGGAHLCGDGVCFLSEEVCISKGHHGGGHHHGDAGLSGHGKESAACVLKSGCGDNQKTQLEDTPFVPEAFFLQREGLHREDLPVESSFYMEPEPFTPERPPAVA